MRRLAAIALLLPLCLARCIPMRAAWMSPGCAPRADYSPLMLISATDFLVNGKSPLSAAVRAATGVALYPDSIRAHAVVVEDQAMCGMLGKRADHWSEHDAYTVMRIGTTYWVRGSGWGYTKVLTLSGDVIARYVDE
jgi:hypothetical protein